MRKSLAAVLFSVTACVAPLFAAGPVRTEIQQNDKLRVYEALYRPGDMSEVARRTMRVVHAIRGGTLERIYEDGKAERDVWKTGETRIISDERAFAVKNVGKSDVRLLIVALK